ncbi:MAG: exodeoxyribonuclease VII small subunit [Clostridia bacterium]|nr:exodeoxyribonuclease VII small subunit [Clostridia bacterium]
MMQKKSFEELMKELESLVNKLENGDTELDKALEMYKEGVSTIKELNDRLNNARRQIEIANEDTKSSE